MDNQHSIYAGPVEYLMAHTPDVPVHFFAPSVLRRTATTFLKNFPGMVTYAVKSNPSPVVLADLMASGIEAFDVASPAEIDAIRRLGPDCTLHYNNPVRSCAEIEYAISNGVRSFSVDDPGELEKLAARTDITSTEASIRFKLPVEGAAYDFGDKFGASPIDAIALLKSAASKGFMPSLTFHPGTQCKDPIAYATYIETAFAIAASANVNLHRLNVGGGFPNARDGEGVDLQPFFDTIRRCTADTPHSPPILCEPGRGLVGDAYALAVRVKSLRETSVYLNDGIYGGLSEFGIMGLSAFHVFGADGNEKHDRSMSRTLFGPTCDSLDVLPGPTMLPHDLAEDDYILFGSMGAYVNGVSTQFNGYGHRDTVLVKALD